MDIVTSINKKQVTSKYSVVVLTKHKAKAEHPEEHNAKYHVNKVFHRNIDSVFRTNCTGFYQGKTQLHQKNKKCTQHDPQQINVG